MPRWPPESAGFSTAGTPTASSAARALSRSRAAAKRGCGTPASASVRRIAILCVIRCAVSVPIPGRPERLRDGCDDRHGSVGRDGEHAVDPVAAADLRDRRDVGEVDRLAHVGHRQAERVGVAVDGDDAKAELLRRRIARRWWRPAPTKRTVFTRARCYLAP